MKPFWRIYRSFIVAFTLALPSQLSWAADKINTAYISTTPGSSSVIWVAKDAKIFDKYGIDATIIFISGSVRGIQSILA
jgi:ABC-type nitrate/sulfonate/bicarbonate transport system substrate-binding protein